MKLRALTIAAMLFAPLAPANAQPPDPRGVAAVKVYDWCMRLPTGTVAECSCVSGFFAGATEEDEFQVLAVLVDFIDVEGAITNVDNLRAAVAAHQQSTGLTPERLDVLLDRFAAFDALGGKADAVCMPIETNARTAASPQ